MVTYLRPSAWFLCLVLFVLALLLEIPLAHADFMEEEASRQLDFAWAELKAGEPEKALKSGGGTLTRLVRAPALEASTFENSA